MPEIVYRKISNLTPLKINPRKITDGAFVVLCESIRDNPDYFEARPLILSDRTGRLVILAGNMRHRAAKEVKLKEVPTVLLSGLTEEREREITIRDNVNNGNWDFDMIMANWADLPLKDWGADIPDFENIDLSEFFKEDTTVKTDSETFSIVLEFKTQKECDRIKQGLLEHGQTYELAVRKLLKL